MKLLIPLIILLSALSAPAEEKKKPLDLNPDLSYMHPKKQNEDLNQKNLEPKAEAAHPPAVSFDPYRQGVDVNLKDDKNKTDKKIFLSPHKKLGLGTSF